MVVDTLTDPAAEARADLIFHALADATRRDILRRAIQGDRSVSALAREYPISITAVQKHVAVLERADLVTRTRQGREQLVQSRPDSLARAHQLLDEIEALWRDRLTRFEALLADPTDPTTDRGTTTN
jgi:DNA-binding transcriptional ArsR family regulator